MSVEAASDWRDHLVSAEEAVSVVRPGDKVFVGSACATPRSLVGALEADVLVGNTRIMRVFQRAGHQLSVKTSAGIEEVTMLFLEHMPEQ